MLKLNPDRNKVMEIREALESNENYCPCKLEKIPENICPCSDLRNNQECCCELYINV